MEQPYSCKDDSVLTYKSESRWSRKTDTSQKEKSIHMSARPNQKGKTYFPAITKTTSREKKNKTDELNYRRADQNKQRPLHRAVSSFSLPQIKVKQESSRVCQRWLSHSNLCASTRESSLLDNKTSSLHSLRTKKINSVLQEDTKTPNFATDLSSTQNLWKSLRIINFEISGKEKRMSKVQKEESLKIGRMELIPRRARKPKENTVKLISPRAELQVTYPTLKLTPIDQCTFFSSPSPSLSMGSLDSIIYGPLTLTQPPPDVTSSCSPSENESTSPSSPQDLSN